MPRPAPFSFLFFWPPRPRMRPARRTDASQPRLGVCTQIFLDREITVQRGQGGVTFHRIDANKVAGRPGGEQARTNAILPSIGLSKQMLSLSRAGRRKDATTNDFAAFPPACSGTRNWQLPQPCGAPIITRARRGCNRLIDRSTRGDTPANHGDWRTAGRDHHRTVNGARCRHRIRRAPA